MIYVACALQGLVSAFLIMYDIVPDRGVVFSRVNTDRFSTAKRGRIYPNRSRSSPPRAPPMVPKMLK